MSKRLHKEERKRLIRQEARRLFLIKGFKETTMEDIVAACDLSKGGVYYHYKNKEQMLSDLMKDGVDDRYEQVINYMNTHQHMDREMLVLDLLLEKLFDHNVMKPLYVICLQEAKKNPEINELMEELQQKASEDFLEFIERLGLHEYVSLTNPEMMFFMNSVFLGVDVLKNQPVTDEIREMYRTMLRAYLNKKNKPKE